MKRLVRTLAAVSAVAALALPTLIAGIPAATAGTNNPCEYNSQDGKWYNCTDNVQIVYTCVFDGDPTDHGDSTLLKSGQKYNVPARKSVYIGKVDYSDGGLATVSDDSSCH